MTTNTSPSHTRCLCEKCGQSIEFESEHVGTVITCPTCGAETRLSVSTKKSGRFKQLFLCCAKIEVILLGMLLLNFAGMAGLFYFVKAQSKSQSAQIQLVNSSLEKIENALGGVHAALEGNLFRRSPAGGRPNNILGSLNEIGDKLERVEKRIQLMDGQPTRIR